MALVTGHYVLPDGNALPVSAIPKIEAIPSKPAITVGGRVISQTPQTVDPDPLTGEFTFSLTPTVDVIDSGFHYLIRGYYLKPDGYDASHGFTRRDLFEYKLYVPTEGGTIGDLVNAPGRPSQAWVIVSLTQPQVEIFGSYWLMADPGGDPSIGNGNLYKVV